MGATAAEKVITTDESIAVDGSDAHDLSIAETSSSGKPRRDFSLEKEIGTTCK
ncbi:hypothetical protein RvY_01878 [Ramazzottius varieornatus]|uniref:Uncharacterized protein n=1 Tax=Ramazzottius varieornatus TaxID=947166 RepID=A0A1D1USH0_RAMVA|nr:hypothetical protein RvY_01878 [Ramazzottius varieornatus]